jgi:ABC-type Zn uptake system ZnuABC Zn-binding protein ZnuA
VLDVDPGIKLRKFADGTLDPHYWLNLGNARKIADNIANAMIETDPAHAAAYREQARVYGGELAEKEREWRAALAPARGAPILTFHDAWFYFAEDFGLKIAGTFQPAAGQEPAPRYLARLRQAIAAGQIHIIFIEPQLSTGVIRSFAKDNHVGIAELDPLGGTAGRTTYLELMAFNVRAVLQALEKTGSAN